MSQTLVKDKRVSIRVTAEQKALLKRAAQIQQVTVSQFVLQTGLKAAEKTASEQMDERVMRVSAEEYDWLMRKLEEPPMPAPQLRELLKRKPVWEEPTS